MDRRQILRAQKAINQVRSDMGRPKQPPPPQKNKTSQFNRLVILLLLIIAAGVWATFALTVRYLNMSVFDLPQAVATAAEPPSPVALTLAPTPTPLVYNRWPKITQTDNRGMSMEIAQVLAITPQIWQFDVVATNTSTMPHVIDLAYFSLDTAPSPNLTLSRSRGNPRLTTVQPGQSAQVAVFFQTDAIGSQLRYRQYVFPLVLP